MWDCGNQAVIEIEPMTKFGAPFDCGSHIAYNYV